MVVNLEYESKSLTTEHIGEDFGRDFTDFNRASSFYQKRVIMKLPPSAKFIMFLLKLKGSMNRKRIIQETLMPDRTVGFALKLLLEKNLIKKEDPSANLGDSSQRGRRRRRRDRRITNYNLISTILPFELAQA